MIVPPSSGTSTLEVLTIENIIARIEQIIFFVIKLSTKIYENIISIFLTDLGEVAPPPSVYTFDDIN